jgi:hypothetical protein
MRSKGIKFFVVAGAVAMLAACGGADNPQPSSTSSEIMPLVVAQNGASAGLLGTYDTKSGNVWVISHVVKDAEDLAAKQGVTHPLIVMADSSTGIDYPYSPEDGTVKLPADLKSSVNLSACVIDAATTKRWRFATFRVGVASDLASQSFVPTELAIEDGGRPAEMCWPAKPPC